MIQPQPQVKDLVLVGGGHAHVHVLKSFAMRPVQGLRITLISRELDTPYSGMLPGHVNGTYTEPEVHINLLRLARFAGARLLVGEVSRIDPESQRLFYRASHTDNLEAERELGFDLLSINTGAAPNCPFDLPNVVPVKPIGRFLPGWQSLKERLVTGARLAIVGGGAGGFEIALAAQRQLGVGVTVSLLTSGHLLPEHGMRVRTLACDALTEAGVELREQFRVAAVTQDLVCSEQGEELPCVGVLWVTGVSAPAWLQNTGLQQDAEGYIEVDNYQRSLSHATVFAAGDVAGMRDQPRPKAGVFAVRQGPILARNLRAAALDEPSRLRPYRAQSKYLALLNCADGTAIASYGGLAIRHRLLWALKDRIDVAFMDKFGKLPPMADDAKPQPSDRLKSPELGDGMRCGGCGSKINATLLKRVLKRIDAGDYPQVVQGIGDDAAVVQRSSGPLVLTTDGFRSMVDDTQLLGRIVAHHALSDVYAMGAQPSAVLVNATLPLMSERMMEDELFDLLTGIQSVLQEERIPLVGGHTAEGLELSVHLTVTGDLDDQEALKKTTAQPGDVLLLTKGLGSGCVLAASMRGECAASTLATTLSALDSSNRHAAEIARAHGASACTDVTGFGFAGHLVEMLESGDEAQTVLGAHIQLDQVPVLDGALDVLENGIVSSLHQANCQALAAFEVLDDPQSLKLQLLADPQTCGGLLLAIPADQAQQCLGALHEAGYDQAARVGTLIEGASRILGAAG